jgi:hypothetical protein
VNIDEINVRRYASANLAQWQPADFAEVPQIAQM